MGSFVLGYYNVEKNIFDIYSFVLFIVTSSLSIFCLLGVFGHLPHPKRNLKASPSLDPNQNQGQHPTSFYPRGGT